MSTLSEMFPVIGGGGTVKQQEFLSSGTFTPSAELLAKGGWVWVYPVGGGGSGGSGHDSYSQPGGGTGGGSGGCPGWIRVKTTGPVTVTIGAGGTVPSNIYSNGNKGGDTTFGALAVAGGGFGGTGSSIPYVMPEDGLAGFGGQNGVPRPAVSSTRPNTFTQGGAMRATKSTVAGAAGPANSGNGGNGGNASGAGQLGGAGGSGYCLVVWEE